ncbi:MAG: lipid-A-disaccharide synthase [Rhodobacteraceae bacterium]|nr:lipid-A-disaccharide synthase [Paracoccaceae bacterium]
MNRTADAPLIYLVACEPSGDVLGGSLMHAIAKETGGRVRFAGVGGPAMTKAGLDTLFDPSELALLGIFEVLPKALLVLRRVRETVADIECVKPSILVTIDSWGFTGRIHQRLARAQHDVPRVRYVAPQVWAWRPGRARQLAKWIHRVLTLFPFEPKYFEVAGLPATWVGHPVIESGAGKGDGAKFRTAHAINDGMPVVCVLPGSRKGEVSRLLPIFRETLKIAAAKLSKFQIVIPTVPAMEALVKSEVSRWPWPAIIVVTPEARDDAFAASRAALAASGTVTLELALAKVPHVIAYRVNALSALAFRMLAKTKSVNLINILLGRPVIAERLQGDCRPEILAEDLVSLVNDDQARAAMLKAFKEAISTLSPADGPPSRAAARAVLAMIAP